jgi:hypothetical protein
VEVEKVSDHQKYDATVTHQRIAIGKAASFAMDLMKLAMIQPCVPDGEDSSGTRQYRVLTEQEVVARALKITELAFAEFQSREWTAEIPSLSDLRRDGAGVGFHASVAKGGDRG